VIAFSPFNRNWKKTKQLGDVTTVLLFLDFSDFVARADKN